ncbi:putative glycosidase CRH2 [Coemansia sp. RSA 1822]|nr:putative glycosidase CRH2 [Coemansia sp. RSA 638]KAJ2480769.1 putative glycosidase CRH2 [Coemansia sp. RSA 2131]KAJ2542737.1 putative glycosidase CRH2 [Coemansia sp. RSA 1853]KAJ2563369.1 putative glycosidase CRH2 [Coemansia sp. RSA 1822]
MKFTSAFAAMALSLASSALAQNKCTEFSPCSREGYCDSDAMFCLWDLCDPATSYNATSCWQPEGCTSRTTTFDSSNDVIAIRTYGGNPQANAFLSVFEPNNAKAANGQLELDMTYDAANNKGFGATVKSSSTIKYGKVTARVKTASVATGVVTSFIIINEQTGDEFDFEWVGKNPAEVQTNYYYMKELDYTKMTSYAMADTSAAYHDYTIDWTAEKTTWLVDNVPIRVLNRADTFDAATGVYKYPTTEARVGFGIWDGGNSGAQGTQEWSGYPTPWSPTTVYKAMVDSVTIECAGGSEPSESESGSEQPTDSTSEQPTDDGNGEHSTDGGEPPIKCRPRY